MRKRLVWVVVSCLMILSLVIISCGQATEETTEGPGVKVTTEQGEQKQKETTTTEKVSEEVVEEGLLSPDVPKYGGRITNAANQDPMGWDHFTAMFPGLSIAEDELLTGDWTLGPSGTGEMSWAYGNNGRVDVLTGNVAESWELVGNDTIIFHIRPGVLFWPKPPANGRELTAEDVAWNIERQWRSDGAGFLARTNGQAERLISATAIDKYTVELKVPSHVQGLHLLLNGERIGLHAPEVVEEFGDYSDWRNVVSTGPFMLTDFVSGSSITYEKHPNYWAEDPLHPGNKLPYLDGVTTLIIQDASTRLAAFRTGKLDYWVGMSWEDWELISSQVPELMANQAFPSGDIIGMRTDKPELPFDDVNVRLAMNLAIDRESLVEDFYGGNAELMGWPYFPIPDHSPFYEPLENLSAGAQEVYSYDPEKAKQLLVDAGYPDGFTTNIDLPTQDADFLSIIKEYLAAIGINMELKISEPGAFTAINRGRTHEQMLYKEAKMYTFAWKMHEVRVESMDNLSFWESPTTREVYNTLNLALGKDDDAWMSELKSVTSHILENAPYIFLPTPYVYDVWWPWMQNYNGAHNVGYFTPNTMLKYTWVDTMMKAQMGY